MKMDSLLIIHKKKSTAATSRFANISLCVAAVGGVNCRLRFGAVGTSARRQKLFSLSVCYGVTLRRQVVKNTPRSPPGAPNPQGGLFSVDELQPSSRICMRAGERDTV